MIRTLRLAAFLLAALLCVGVYAQDPSAAPSTAPTPAPTIAELRARLDDIPLTLRSNGDIKRARAEIDEIGAEGDQFVAARTGPLADLNARLGELGNPPAPGATEDPDITRQRSALTKQRNVLDADVRLARLLTTNAQQRSSDLLAQRRALFEAQLTERSPSPLGADFWRDLDSAWPDDIRRLRALGVEIGAGIDVASQPANRTPVIVALVMALLLIVLGNWLAERGLTRLAAGVLPVGRLRRSLLVIAIVVVNVLLVAAGAHWAFHVVDERGMWGAQAHKAMLALVQSLVFIAFVVGLGRALLSTSRPSWRLPQMNDALVSRLAPMPWLVALVAALVWAPAQVNAMIDASFAAVVAAHVVTALALTGLIAIVLMRLKAPKAAATEAVAPATGAAANGNADPGSAASQAPLERPMWVGIVLACVTVVMVAIWLLVAVGYVALASFMASQLVWSGIVAAAFYVLFKFVDDVFMTTVSSRSSFGQRLEKSFGLAPSTLDQTAVALSGLARAALFFYMLLALITPLGTSPAEVLARSGKLGDGLKIGAFQVVPGAIFSAIAVVVVGFILLRVLKRWLENSYLPETTLEAGMRSSITKLLGYAGTVVVVAFGLSALGIGINRIAWVASALSVGIGFGLQAIVQNFVSGLILLAERPVKVGDWVVLGTAEGDVKRINVRATEIQLGDRSTLIVPNSEFITKTVRNMTLTAAEGRVLLRVPMPLTTDAHRTRDVMLAACSEHTAVLPTPAPSVTLDGIEGGFLIFQLIAYVQSPRLSGGVRSDLLFTILDGLNAAQLPLASYAAAAAPSPQQPESTVPGPAPGPAQG